MRRNELAPFQSIHDLGVIHGVVRKEYILVGDDKSVMIVDFGSSEIDGLSEGVVAMEDKEDKMLYGLVNTGDSLTGGEGE